MLNIPSSVKALFKRDGVHKNFRVHFPGGEMADLTNDNVVQESVKFSESICSQDVFKFGLTEASVIEFETVGVANMYGMVIECSCEIDCSSLSAADKATIAAGTWEGAWDGVNAVFSVPYGTFRVESCPRDHQAMAHRKVTAYTESMSEPNPFEVAKCALATPLKQYKPSMRALAMEQVLRYSPDELLNLGYSKASRTSSLRQYPFSTNPYTWYPFWEEQITAKDANNNDVSVSLQMYGSATDSMIWLDYELASFDYDGQVYDDEADFALIADALDSAGVDAGNSGFASLMEMAKSLSLPSFRPFVSFSSLEYASKHGNNWSTVNGNGFNIVYANDKELIYPYFGSFNWYKNIYSVPVNMNKVYLRCVERVDLSINGVAATVFSKTKPKIWEYSTGSSDSDFLIFDPTSDERKNVAWGGKANLKAYIGAFAAEEIAQGFLELTAKFATASRLGGNKIISIDNTSPVSIIPGEYSQMWWDEYNVEPIGTIRYSYTDEAGEEQIVDYVFGSGASVYDMTDNAVLKLMEGADPATIEAMLDASFIPYISAVNFVPIDLALKGLPYIEAGDALSVTAQDATVCNSFALRHEISGIQALAAQIDSESGLIIESGVGS